MDKYIINAITNAQVLLNMVKEDMVDELNTKYKKEYVEYKITRSLSDMIEYGNEFNWSDSIASCAELYQDQDNALKVVTKSIPSLEDLIDYKDERQRVYEYFNNELEKIEFRPQSIVDYQEYRRRELDTLDRLIILCKIDLNVKLTPEEKLLNEIFYR